MLCHDLSVRSRWAELKMWQDLSCRGIEVLSYGFSKFRKTRSPVFLVLQFVIYAWHTTTTRLAYREGKLSEQEVVTVTMTTVPAACCALSSSCSACPWSTLNPSSALCYSPSTLRSQTSASTRAHLMKTKVHYIITEKVKVVCWPWPGVPVAQKLSFQGWQPRGCSGETPPPSRYAAVAAPPAPSARCWTGGWDDRAPHSPPCLS